MSALDRIISRFQSASPEARLELLLDYANRLPPVPDRYQAAIAQGVNRVHECQTPVFLFPEFEDGTFRLYADVPREAPTVRGFVSLLIKGLTGATPAEVAAVPLDILDRMQLSEILGMTRMQGLSAVARQVKRMGEASAAGPSA